MVRWRISIASFDGRVGGLDHCRLGESEVEGVGDIGASDEVGLPESAQEPTDTFGLDFDGAPDVDAGGSGPVEVDVDSPEVFWFAE